MEVDEEGNVKVEGHDFKGSACELPKDLLKDLGGESATTKKREFYLKEERKVAARRA